MGVNLRLSGHDAGHATHLCPNRARSRLYEWLLSLPDAAYPAPRQLTLDGSFEDTEALAVQLEAVFAEHPPEDTDVRIVADRRLDLLGGGYPDETMTIE